MRFRFCGDLDCPDWVLAEISTLAKISSVKLKLICAQVLRDLLGGSMEYEKILKLTLDAKLESGDVKATIAVLGFILSSAAKHGVDSESLSSELQQLGLPKEHASGLCRSYEEKQSSLQDSLRAASLRLSRLGSVCWRVDYTLSSSELQEVHEPLVHLTFTVRDGQHGSTAAVPMAVSADKFRVLLAGETPGQELVVAAGREVAVGLRGHRGARAAPPPPAPCLRRAEAGAGADEHTELSRAAAGGSRCARGQLQ
uniref:COMM domain containing 4 n=1 Tax=Strigops habroptila TaxID=2489341 RepID=A0A672V1A1_STRHB